MDIKAILESVTISISTGLLIIILAGGQPKLDSYAALMRIDTKSDEFKKELRDMSGAVQIENGDNGDVIVLLTASVIENRKRSTKWKGSTTEEVILAKEGPYYQYASVTRKGFQTKKASKRNKYLCKFVLIFGPVCPSNVVYQGQSSNGSGEYKRCKVPGQKDEIFCYE